MKLITWNCNMGFAKKARQLFQCRPDLAVVQECSEASTRTGYEGYSGLWFGSNSNKGLGVFCKEGWRSRVIATPLQQWVVPIEISGPMNFTLVAIWACATTKNRKESYVGQIHRSLSSHPEWLKGPCTVIAGDFNSNAVWDKNRPNNHSALVMKLADHGLVSAYHAATDEEHGHESTPTFYLYRHLNKPYHLDYVFIPDSWKDRARVSVGVLGEWSKLSDHSPVIVDIDLEGSKPDSE
jgi:endonuclease/exonuclease/phosphatase family metal-dependent hydrolase